MYLESDLAGQNVLVSGAAGCIGAWAIKILQESGANPVAYDLSSDRSRLALIMENADEVIWKTATLAITISCSMC